jgi:hypothetical protein
MTKRVVIISRYHHRDADPDDLCGIQVVLQDENERVLDFRLWTLDEPIDMSAEEVEQQVREYVFSLGKLHSIVFIWTSLTYEDELCSCCGELAQRTINKKILARVLK